MMFPLRRHRDQCFLAGFVATRWAFQGVAARLLFHVGPDQYETQFEAPLNPDAAKVQIITEKRAALLEHFSGHAYFGDDNVILPREPVLTRMETILCAPTVGVVGGQYAGDHVGCGCMTLRGDLAYMINPLVAWGCECNYITSRLGEAGFSVLSMQCAGMKHPRALKAGRLYERALDPGNALARLDWRGETLAPHVLEVPFETLLRTIERHGERWVARLVA